MFADNIKQRYVKKNVKVELFFNRPFQYVDS